MSHAESLPALLLFHGGGFQMGAPEACGQLAKFLALANGVVVVAPSYRLASIDKSTFPGVLDDVSHAFSWVIRNAVALRINPGCVSVGGDSAGACLAMHLAVNSPFMSLDSSGRRPAGLIAQWGPLDFVERWMDNGEKPGAEQYLLGTTYDKNPDLYRQASPLAHVQPDLPPALFAYGRLDPVVHARQGSLGHRVWQKAAGYSELHIVDGIGHEAQGDIRAAMISHMRIVSAFLAAHCGKPRD
jgi:acetyl esterase/lipase